jgi:hypothetical protein
MAIATHPFVGVFTGDRTHSSFLTGEAMSVQIAPRAGATWSPLSAVVVAGSEAGDGPSSVTACPFVTFFVSRESARGYLAAKASLRAEVLSMPEAIQAGRAVFRDLLDVGSPPGTAGARLEGKRN